MAKLDMSKLFDEEQFVYKKRNMYNFKNNINYRNTIRISKSDLENLPDDIEPFTTLENIRKSKFVKDVYFDVFYTSIHPDSYGDKFFVVSAARIKNKNRNENNTREYNTFISISFSFTMKVLTVPESRFRNRKIYNPYKIKYFGRCSIGNVDIFEHEEEFNCWWEAINRCYNEKSPSYGFYYNNYIMCAFNCFEDLVNFNEGLKKKGYNPILNPNDRHLYIAPDPRIDIDSRRSCALLNRLRYTSTQYNYASLTADENYMPIEERWNQVYNDKHAGGRPASNNNHISLLKQELPRPVENEPKPQEEGKKLLYKLIDK